MKGRLRQFVFRIRLAYMYSRQKCSSVVTTDSEAVYKTARYLGIRLETSKRIREWAEGEVMCDDEDEHCLSLPPGQILTGIRQKYTLEVISRDPGENWAPMAAAAERARQERKK